MFHDAVVVEDRTICTAQPRHKQKFLFLWSGPKAIFDGLNGPVQFCAFRFTPVAVVGSRKGRWSVYLNGRDTEQYDEVIRDWEQGISFDNQNRCQFMAVREGQLFLVTKE